MNQVSVSFYGCRLAVGTLRPADAAISFDLFSKDLTVDLKQNDKEVCERVSLNEELEQEETTDVEKKVENFQEFVKIDTLPEVMNKSEPVVVVLPPVEISAKRKPEPRKRSASPAINKRQECAAFWKRLPAEGYFPNKPLDLTILSTIAPTATIEDVAEPSSRRPLERRCFDERKSFLYERLMAAFYLGNGKLPANSDCKYAQIPGNRIANSLDEEFELSSCDLTERTVDCLLHAGLLRANDLRMECCDVAADIDGTTSAKIELDRRLAKESEDDQLSCLIRAKTREWQKIMLSGFQRLYSLRQAVLREKAEIEADREAAEAEWQALRKWQRRGARRRAPKPSNKSSTVDMTNHEVIERLQNSDDE